MTKSELLETAKPILFNTDMVKAILEGRKTVTRRVVKPQPLMDDNHKPHHAIFFRGHDGKAPTIHFEFLLENNVGCDANVIIPKYDFDDILYVRETYYRTYHHQYGKNFYRADGAEIQMPTINGDTVTYGKADGLKWKPSIHMPKEASRIFLKVTDVRVERLQDINEYGAEEEGVEGVETEWLPTYIDNFIRLWNSTIKKRPR